MKDPSQQRSERTSWLKRCCRIILRIVLVLTLSGVFLRWTIRDSLPGFATLYYMTPLPLLVVGCLTLFGHDLWRRNRWRTLFWCGILILVSMSWWQQDFRYAAQKESAHDDIVVLFANLASNEDFDDLAEQIRQLNPDVIAFVEAMSTTSELQAMWRDSFPDHEWSMVNWGTQLFVKGKVGRPWVKPLKDGTILSRSVMTIRGQEIHCYIADVASTLFLSRKPAIDTLNQFTDSSGQRPVIIMGDFNTPKDSVHFSSLRTSFREVIEDSGTGYSPTWPWPLPVLSLDQIWVNARVEPVSARLIENPRSDHRMLMARVRVHVDEP